MRRKVSSLPPPKLLEKDPAKAKAFLTNYTNMTAQSTFDTWKRLGEFIIVKYNDGSRPQDERRKN